MPALAGRPNGLGLDSQKTGVARVLMVNALNVAQALVVYSIKAYRFREELAVRADHVLSVVIEPGP